MSATEYSFHTYTPAELAVDRVIHFVGVPAAVACAWWLIASADPVGGDRLLLTLALYGAALVGTLGTSAAYHLTRPGRSKEKLRSLDRAMIFFMIGATYTPFAVNVLASDDGMILCAEVWTLALIGIVISLRYPRRYEGILLALYLLMGWLVLGVIPSFLRNLPHATLLLLLLGGIVLTIGAFFHTRHRMKFHNATWHVLVLIGTGLHVAALHTAFDTARVML